MRKHILKWVPLMMAAILALTTGIGAAEGNPAVTATETEQETITESTAETATENTGTVETEAAESAPGRTETAEATEPEQTGKTDGVLSDLYSAGEKLLMETENVTLKGEAEFFLDEVSFKKASGTYIQDGFDAFQQIDLSGKDNEGLERETGYAVLDLDGKVTASEFYHKVDHRIDRLAAPRSTILEGTRDVLQLLRLGRAAVHVLGQSSAVDVQLHEENSVRKIIMTAGETTEIPEVVQSALNLLWQEGIDRYYTSEYRNLYPDPYASIEDWGTPTMGIAMTTREIVLYDLQMEAETDAEGRIASLNGDAAFRLQGGSSEHDLKVHFSLEAKNYGTSSVRENADVRERMNISNFSYGDRLPTTPVFTGQMSQRAIDSDEDAIAYAKEIWQMDYLGAVDLSDFTWSVRPTQNGHIGVWGYDLSDLPSHYYMIETDQTGWIYSLRNAASDLDFAEEYWSEDMGEPEWDDYRLKLIDMSLDFAEALNPQDRERIEGIRHENNYGKGTWGVYVPGYGGASMHNDALFLNFYGEADEQYTRRTKIVFQIAPEFRVVLFNQLNNPLEGGNG